MEANELMIGDWVYCPTHTQKIRVKNILEVGGYFQQEICGSQGDMYIEMVNIEPIPLTKDILLMNGLVFNEYWDEYDLNLDKNTYLSIECSINEKYYITISSYSKPIMLKYVHELQHLFRMCGLNDLANNLKIE